MKSIIETKNIDVINITEHIVKEYLIDHSSWSESTVIAIDRIINFGDNYTTSGDTRVLSNGLLPRLAPIAMFYASTNIDKYPIHRKLYELERVIRLTHNDDLTVVAGCTFCTFLEIVFRRDQNKFFSHSARKLVLMELASHAIYLEDKFNETSSSVTNAISKLIENSKNLKRRFINELFEDITSPTLKSLLSTLIVWLSGNFDRSDITYAVTLNNENNYNGSCVGALIGGLYGIDEFTEEEMNMIERYEEIMQCSEGFIASLYLKIRNITTDLKPFENYNNFIDKYYHECKKSLDPKYENIDRNEFFNNLSFNLFFTLLVSNANSWDLYFYPRKFYYLWRSSFTILNTNSTWDDESRQHIEENNMVVVSAAYTAASNMIKKFLKHTFRLCIDEVKNLFTKRTPVYTSLWIIFFMGQGLAFIFSFANRGKMVSLPIPWNEQEYRRQLRLPQFNPHSYIAV